MSLLILKVQISISYVFELIKNDNMNIAQKVFGSNRCQKIKTKEKKNWYILLACFKKKGKKSWIWCVILWDVEKKKVWMWLMGMHCDVDTCRSLYKSHAQRQYGKPEEWVFVPWGTHTKQYGLSVSTTYCTWFIFSASSICKYLWVWDLFYIDFS